MASKKGGLIPHQNNRSFFATNIAQPKTGLFIIQQLDKMNKYEAYADALSILLAFQFAQLLADGDWEDENRMKAIGITIDVIPVLRKKGSFPSGGVIAKSSQPANIGFGESIFPPLKLNP